eukprot:2635595-Pyramimonas_sp.AAC.1
MDEVASLAASTRSQRIKELFGDRSQFREWSEKLLNDVGPVNVKNRISGKHLNAMLKTLDGALQHQNDDCM